MSPKRRMKSKESPTQVKRQRPDGTDGTGSPEAAEASAACEALVLANAHDDFGGGELLPLRRGRGGRGGQGVRGSRGLKAVHNSRELVMLEADRSNVEVKSTMKETLAGLQLSGFLPGLQRLGVETINDISDLDLADLEEVGLTRVQVRRLQQAAAASGPAGAGAAGGRPSGGPAAAAPQARLAHGEERLGRLEEALPHKAEGSPGGGGAAGVPAATGELPTDGPKELELRGEAALEIEHIPTSVRTLSVDLSEMDVGDTGVAALAAKLPSGLADLMLDLRRTKVTQSNAQLEETVRARCGKGCKISIYT